MQIFPIEARPGWLAMAPMPGLDAALEDDVAAIAAWGANLVLTMTPKEELVRLGAAGLWASLAGHNVEWIHVPIADFGAPFGGTLQRWQVAAQATHRLLAQGGRVLAHCRGGCGRSGMAVLRLMVERGEGPVAALTRLRAARPCAVETAGQFAWAAAPALSA